MKTSANLEQSYNRAVQIAAKRRHEFLTPEHLLLSLLDDSEATRVLKGAGADTDTLRRDLTDYIDTKLSNTVLSSDKEPVPSQAFRAMVQRTEIAATAAGKTVMDSVQVIIAMLGERDGTAHYLMRQQGVTQEKILNFNTYGNTSAPAKPAAANENEAKDDSALGTYAVNLNKKARNGKIDPLVGRESEVDRVIQIMARRKKNNPILVGDPGTGKTAIAEGFAQRIVDGNVPEELEGFTIYALDMGAMVAGTKYRGDFEERMKKVIEEAQADPKAILLIDEIHTLIGAGAAGGSMDASNLLKPALADGSIKCIGATTYAEYRKYFEKDAALSRRFQKVDVAEPSIEDAVLTLNGVSKYLAQHHNVEFTPGAIRAAVELSAKYIIDRRLPDKAIDVLDEVAASQILLPVDQRKKVFDVADIEETIAKLTNTPKKTVTADETSIMANLGDNLKAKVFGQNSAVDALVDAFQIARAGLGDTTKPLGSFLMDGPTGVGKTELTKQLAEELGIPLIRFDMSEYGEKHNVARMIGAPPGFVGYDQPGLLTDAVTKNPHCIILLDEIEKAHPDVFNILLQVMDHGALTDGNGKRADFRNIILVMTTNVSANAIVENTVGFGDFDSVVSNERSGVTPAVKASFKPEFINRLDEILTFGHLTRDIIDNVAGKFLTQLKNQLAAKNVVMEETPALRDHLAETGYDREMGARPMARVIQDKIKKPLSKAILFGELVNGGSVQVDFDKAEKKITFNFNQASAPDEGTKKGQTLRLPAPSVS
ncbi:MAG: AAA family ATPase [Micavibrio sp.]